MCNFQLFIRDISCCFIILHHSFLDLLPLQGVGKMLLVEYSVEHHISLDFQVENLDCLKLCMLKYVLETYIGL